MEKIGNYLSGVFSTAKGLRSDKGFINVVYAGSLTDGAPTEAELDALIGESAAAKGAGWSSIVSDTDGTALKYHVYSDGTSWLYSVAVAAV